MRSITFFLTVLTVLSCSVNSKSFESVQAELAKARQNAGPAPKSQPVPAQIPGLLDGKIVYSNAAPATSSKVEASAGCSNCTSSLKFAGAAAKKYEVGNKIPTLPFKTKTSWAGLMPISKLKRSGEARSLYFWLWGKETNAANADTVIWLNGGPGCSSLGGMTQENGPWNYFNVSQPAKPNPYSWTEAANMLYLEQPVGTGFTMGPITNTNEDQVAQDFEDFLTNFFITFPELKKNRLFITGESYAGQYIPYMMNHLYKKGNKFNLHGGIIIDGVITDVTLYLEVPAARFVEKNKGLLKLSDDQVRQVESDASYCHYNAFVQDNLVYPSKGQLPPYDDGGQSCTPFETYANNPNFSYYNIAQNNTDPVSPLGGPTLQSPTTYSTFFDNMALQTYIHAPHVKWNQCNTAFAGQSQYDTSVPVDSNGVLQNVIEKSSSFMIMNGDLDGLIMTEGIALALQNLTWNGARGFNKAPTAPVYDTTGAKSGTYTRERGLTFAIIPKSGHMIPGDTPSLGLAALKTLVGQSDFTVPGKH